MKNLSVTFTLIFSLALAFISKAQTDCITAQPITINQSPFDTRINQTFITYEDVNWYKIPVNKDSVDLQIVSSLDSFVYRANKIELYSGNCSNLTLLKTDTLTSTNDTLLNINLGGLLPNDSLYLKITTTINSVCNLCLFKSASFILKINYVNSPLADCLVCNPTSFDFVCNGGFEIHDNGVNAGMGHIFEACGWTNLSTSPANGSIGTPDYFSLDAPVGATNYLPCNAAGKQMPHTGNSMAGFCGGTSSSNPSQPWFEYIRTHLINPLSPGQTYTITFWLSLGEGSKLKANEVGVYFFNTLPGSVPLNTTNMVNVTPQLIADVSNVGITNWEQFSLTYTVPAGVTGLQNILIGNFSGTVLTPISCQSATTNCTNISCGNQAYYYIDDISITGPVVVNQTTVQGCLGTSTTLTSTLPQPLNWANSNWAVSSSTNQSITVSAVGTYYAFSTNNALGCKNVEVFNVVHTMAPNQWITLTPDNPTICIGESITTTASGLSNNIYTWYTTPFSTNYFPTSAPISTGATYSFTPTTTTTLYVGGHAANGCRQFTETTITVINPPEAIINTTDLTMCNNMLFNGTYTAAPQTAGSIYSWAITINGVPHTDFTTSANGQSIVVDWSNVYGGANNAQICLTVDNGSCSRSTCIDVNKCCNAPRDQYIFTSQQPNYFNGIHNNETVIVSGNFSASLAAQFVGCNITFTEGSKITEQTNDLLVFINCHLNTCSGMWKGIEMMPSCSLRVADCLVEDAETFAKANTSCGLDFFNNIINRCATGIDLTNFAGGNAIVKGGTFTCRDNIPFPFNTSNNINYIQYINSFPLTTLHPNSIGLNNQISQYGIKTENLGTPQLWLRRGNGTYSHLLVVFDNQETGIYAKNSGFKLHGVYYNKCGDNGTTQTYIQNIRGGLVIEKSPKYNSNPLMEVGDNTQYNENYFIDCLNGIYCTGSENLNVLKNKFERISETAIYMQNGTSAFTANIKNNKFIDTKKLGIHMFINNSLKANIFENRFEGTGTTNSLSARAIWLQEMNLSNTSRYIVYNNNIKEFKTSIVAEQITNKSNIYDNQIDMKNDNTPFDFQFGILLVNSNFTKIVNNQITASVNTNEPVRWWQYGIYNSYSPNTYIACNFISGPDVSLTCQGPTPVTIVNNTFKNPNFAGFWLHSNGIAGPQGNSTVPSDNKWQYAGNIVNTYNPFKTYTSLNTNGVVSPFYYRNILQYIPNFNGFDVSAGQFSTPIPTGSPYIMDSSAPLTQCSYTPTPTYRANINNNMAQKTIKAQLDINTNIEKTYYHARKALYNTLTLDSIGTINDTVITNFKTNVANYNMGKLLETDVLINQGLINDDNNILTQAEQTNNIVSIESIEQNQKEVNEIFIRYAKNNNHFNHADKQRLKQLAALCPESDGTAVYQARTLASKFDNTLYYNECELIDPLNAGSNSSHKATEIKNTISSNNELSIFPNPAENKLYINFNNLSEPDNIEILVYSSLGELVKKTIYKGVLNYELDITEINSGTYFIKIVKNNLNIKTEKLVIIK